GTFLVFTVDGGVSQVDRDAIAIDEIPGRVAAFRRGMEPNEVPIAVVLGLRPLQHFSARRPARHVELSRVDAKVGRKRYGGGRRDRDVDGSRVVEGEQNRSENHGGSERSYKNRVLLRLWRCAYQVSGLQRLRNGSAVRRCDTDNRAER